jgi:hypothetical protein
MLWLLRTRTELPVPRRAGCALLQITQGTQRPAGAAHLDELQHGTEVDGE